MTAEPYGTARQVFWVGDDGAMYRRWTTRQPRKLSVSMVRVRVGSGHARLVSVSRLAAKMADNMACRHADHGGGETEPEQRDGGIAVGEQGHDGDDA